MKRRRGVSLTQNAVQNLSVEVRRLFNIAEITASPPGNTRSDRFFISAHDPLFRLDAFVIGYNFSVRWHALKINARRRTAKENRTQQSYRKPESKRLRPIGELIAEFKHGVSPLVRRCTTDTL